MTTASPKKSRGNPGLKGRLLDKSVEAYVLALETINRLSIRYRVETFAYLICNAWELLLKAKILKDAGTKKAIYYKKRKGEPRRSLSLRDCIKRTFLNEKDPTRRNIEHVANLRDEAVHFVIADVPKDVLALFQSCVLNYHRRLVEWFDVSLKERVSVGMMTIVYDFNPEDFDLNNPVLRRRLGREAADYLTGIQAALRSEFTELGKPAEFSIDIGYTLALVPKVGAADIVLTKGDTGATIKVVEVAKDPSKTHPLRQKEVVDQVNAGLSVGTAVNSYCVQCVNKAYGIKKRPEFYYKGSVKGSPSQYSQAFVDWLLKEHGKDTEFFSKARLKAKSM